MVRRWKNEFSKDPGEISAQKVFSLPCRESIRYAAESRGQRLRRGARLLGARLRREEENACLVEQLPDRPCCAQRRTDFQRGEKETPPSGINVSSGNQRAIFSVGLRDQGV